MEKCILKNEPKQIHFIKGEGYFRLKQLNLICDDNKKRPFLFCLTGNIIESIIYAPRSDYLRSAYVRRNYIRDLIGDFAETIDCFIFNVIDKSSKWCENNKHTKILCTSSLRKGLGITGDLFINISKFLYMKKNKAMLFNDFDLFLTKVNAVKGNKYKLTKEEKEYKIYDIRKLVTSNSYIVKHLGKKLRKIIKEQIKRNENIDPCRYRLREAIMNMILNKSNYQQIKYLQSYNLI